MSEEWGTPISKGKIIDRRNRLIEYRNTREIRTIPLSRVIDENILDINYMIYEIERLNNIKKKAINELFDLKDMIYKPETREINFDIQNKISSIIKILGSDKE